MRCHVGVTSLVRPVRLATCLARPWARRAGGELFVEGEEVLQEGPHAAGHKHDTDLGLLAVGAALARDPELALLPEDGLGGEVAQLADTEGRCRAKSSR